MSSILIWIACRNYEHYLPDAVASVQAQTIPVQAFVAHDACGTEENGGPARVRNYALEHSGDAQYVIFLDADDLIPPDYAEQLSKVAKGDECVVACNARCFGDSHQEIQVRRPVNLGALMECNTVHVSALVSLSLLRKYGGFDPALPAYEDWELWCRLASSGVEFRYSPDTYLFIRSHADSRHARKTMQLPEMQRFLTQKYDAFQKRTA